MRRLLHLAAGAVVGLPFVATAAIGSDRVALDCPKSAVPAGAQVGQTVTVKRGTTCTITEIGTATTSTTTTTTTLPPASTTTSTTTSSTSTPPTSPTSVASSPPTTSPAGTATFSATFDTPADFYDRFDTFAGNFVDPEHHRTDWWINRDGDGVTPPVVHGDHDMACGGPDTHRDLDVHNPDTSQYFWYCAPSGPASGHIMTGFTTTGYVIFSFAPNRSFNNVTKVCWDINATEEGGGKWTNMVIIPEALHQQFAPRLDYTTPGFNNGGTGDFNIQAEDHPGLDIWGVKDFRGGQHFYIGANMLMDDDNVRTTTDKATRYRHCVEETSPTTSRLTVARPGGGTSVYDLPSGMPDGQVRVIFQDDMYDPVKRDGYSENNVTWHWDNIQITAGA